VKILILRGGASRTRPPGALASAAWTRERGVMALGNGSGQWVLINMSPAVAHQLDSDVRLASHAGLCNAEVRAVVLTDAQVDHVGGLLSLRGGAPIDLYATPAVFEQLTTALPVLPVLQHYCGVHWRVMPVAGDRRVASFRVEGLPSLEFTAIATEGVRPPHLAHGEGPQVGDSIALAVRDLATGQRLFCAPGLSRIGATELAWMQGADCLLLDDLPAGDSGSTSDSTSGSGAGVGTNTITDTDTDADADADSRQPWLALLRDLPARNKVLFCDAPSETQRADWAAAGIALAYDGMEIEV